MGFSQNLTSPQGLSLIMRGEVGGCGGGSDLRHTTPLPKIKNFVLVFSGESRVV